jgi:ornithine decarboxylase
MKSKFVLSKSKLLNQYKVLAQECDIISYSLKSNPIVGKILEKETNCEFSIHTTQAIKELQDPSRVTIFLQACNNEQIKELLKKGLTKFVVDNKKDLDVLLDSIEGNKIELFLRMRLKERTIHTGKHFVFGFFAKDVNELVPELLDNKNIYSLGIHFHRKTQNIHEWSLAYELKDSLSEETLQAISKINFGGGLPITYKNSRDRIEHIFNQIRELREWVSKYNIKIVAEPGRFLAGPAINLHTQIINIYDQNIIINASVYNAAMDTFIANVRLQVEEELDKGTPYVIKGCTPDSVDVFRYRCFLENPKVGDLVVLLSAGAYNFYSDFCFLDKLETEIVE